MTYTIKKYCDKNWNNRDIEGLERQFKQMELFPLEICQLLDLMPKSLLELQLIIEEMEERYDLQTLEKILEMVQVSNE